MEKTLNECQNCEYHKIDMIKFVGCVYNKEFILMLPVKENKLIECIK